MGGCVKAPFSYCPYAIERDIATMAFNHLWNRLDWIHHDKVPRREYYVALNRQDYAYGKADFSRTYKSQPMDSVLEMLWRKAEAATGVLFDVVFLNGYADGKDHLGWHSDDSPEMDDARPIAIVSLGETREIWFRPKPKPRVIRSVDLEAEKLVERLKLGHGSLCLMAPGMQDTHQHRIPKAAFMVCGPRISLTFRGYVKP